MKTYYDNNDPALCLKPLSVEMVAKSNNDGKKNQLEAIHAKYQSVSTVSSPAIKWHWMNILNNFVTG